MKIILLIGLFAWSLFAAGGDTLAYTARVDSLADNDVFYADIHWKSMIDTVKAFINGRLGDYNIASDANIQGTKLDSTTNTVLTDIRVNGALLLAEVASIDTPDVGYGSIGFDTSGIPYAVNDLGYKYSFGGIRATVSWNLFGSKLTPDSVYIKDVYVPSAVRTDPVIVDYDEANKHCRANPQPAWIITLKGEVFTDDTVRVYLVVSDSCNFGNNLLTVMVMK